MTSVCLLNIYHYPPPLSQFLHTITSSSEPLSGSLENLARDLEEMTGERGLPIDHTTSYRWVQRSAPELKNRVRIQLPATNKVRGQ